MPDEIRDMPCEAAKCRNPVRKKELGKTARKARREFTKLWISGRASEDRDRGVLPLPFN